MGSMVKHLQLEAIPTVTKRLSLALPVSESQLVGECLRSSQSSTYLVQAVVGEGTFGKVVKCIKTDTKQTVAVKIIKNHLREARLAQQEMDILKKLRALNPDKCNFVRFNSFFIDRGNICLEFEMLDMSLKDFMKQRGHLPLNNIRPILHQLATALKHLESVRIIHADLKLENIMMVDHVRQPLRVKIIDFGLARDVSKAKVRSCVQTLWYRAPEIIVGLLFTEAIDMWSLGCVAAELLLCYPLYPGNTEYDMMRYITETQGQPPDHLLDSGDKSRDFFNKQTSSTQHLWRLKTPVEYKTETGIQYVPIKRYRFSSLDDLKQFDLPCHLNAADKMAEVHDRWEFVDLLKQLLQLDAGRRMKPCQVLEHPFISMHHLVDNHHHSSHVRSCIQMMDICRRQRLTSDPKKGAGPQSSHQPFQHQQTSSSTATLVQQRIPLQVHSVSTSVNPHSSTTVKRKKGTQQPKLPSESGVAPPISSNQPGSRGSNRGVAQVRSDMKRKRVEVEAGKKDSFGWCENRHSNTKMPPPTSTAIRPILTSGPPTFKSEANRKVERKDLLGKTKSSAGKLASESRKRTAPYNKSQRAAQPRPSQGHRDRRPPSSVSLLQPVQDICRRQSLTSDLKKGAGPQSSHQPFQHQQTSSSTATLVQQRIPLQVHSVSTSVNPHSSTTVKRKKGTQQPKLPSESGVAPPISSDQPGSHQPAQPRHNQGHHDRRPPSSVSLLQPVQARATTSTTQARCLSTLAQVWYKAFAPERLSRPRPTGTGRNNAYPGTQTPLLGPSKTAPKPSRSHITSALPVSPLLHPSPESEVKWILFPIDL